MPKIEWTGLPEALRRHLFLRARERAISDEDLLALEDVAGIWTRGPGRPLVQGLRLVQALR